MSKELTPLEALRIIREHDFPTMIATMPPIPATWGGKTEGELWEIIETALKDYEEGLENAKTYVKHTSKQALFDLLGLALKNVDRRYWKLPEQLFDDANKSLKALEIIKEHRLDIDWFLQFVEQDISYKNYVCCVEDSDNEFAKRFLLNEEEYNLLKEVLE